MDENWTKELDGKTPSSDDKELVKRMREDELKKNSENESEHVTSVFQRVAQRAMGQEKKPAMAKPVADQRPARQVRRRHDCRPPQWCLQLALEMPECSQKRRC